MRNILILGLIALFCYINQKINYISNDLSPPPLERQVYYQIGTIDPRFNLTENEAKILLNEAAKIWEQPLGRKFFFYSPRAAFKVNFIYDQRQKNTNEKQRVERELADGDGKTQVASANFEQQKTILNDEYRHHARELTVLNARIIHRQQLVALVNSHGGTSLREAQAYQAEKQQLDRDITAYNLYNTVLETKRANLIHQAEIIQSQVDANKQKANSYNKKFSGKPFEVGIYNGNEINVYEFENKNYLRLVLAHELGHALGLNHNNDPYALMYPTIGAQDMVNFRLMPSDIDLLYGRVKGH